METVVASATGPLPPTPSYDMERSSTRCAERMAIQFFEQTAARGPEYQSMLMNKILRNHVWQGVLTPYSELESAHKTLECISRGWQFVKGCHSKDDQRAPNVIIPMVASDTNQSNRQTSLLTGIHRRNFKRGIQRRLSLEARIDNQLWAFCGKSRKDALSQELKIVVEKFWDENTRVSPSRKDVVMRRLDRNLWESHAGHLLLESQLSFYTRFMEEVPGAQISLRSFERLKPWYIRRLKEFNSCCCQYHVQIAELKDGYNALRTGSLHVNCSCTCIVCKSDRPGGCKANTTTVTGVTAMCQLILCPKASDTEFHHLACIQGECGHCGISKLFFRPQELASETEDVVPWRCFENVFLGKKDDGTDRHALRLKFKHTPALNLITFLKPKLSKFLVHNFEARWQDKMFKNCLENLSSDNILSVIDFAKNYSFKWQNEVQTQHWFSFQVTILVHLTFRVTPDWDGDLKIKILCEYHFYISDDSKHDNLFVQHCFGLHREFLTKQGFPLPVEHIVFSDGCSTQFKCARSFFFCFSIPFTNEV